MSEPTLRIPVDIRLDGVAVGEHLLPYPLLLADIDALVEEEPWKLEGLAKARTRARWVWNTSGLSAVAKADVYAAELTFETKAFDITIEGRPYSEHFAEQGPTYAFVDFGTGQLMAARDAKRDADQQMRSITVSQKVPRSAPKAKKSAAAPTPPPAPVEDTATFADLNLKLAVLQVLMYEKELLTPAFDVAAFVESYEERTIDLAEEGHEPIPEVLAHFAALPIPKALLAEVDEIYQDGGNDIYLQVAPNWDGTDSSFDIADFSDLDQLPNVRSMTLTGVDEATLEALRARGIDADEL